MSVKQRLISFAKSQEKSVRAFEIKCGLTIGYINAIRVSRGYVQRCVFEEWRGMRQKKAVIADSLCGLYWIL